MNADSRRRPKVVVTNRIHPSVLSQLEAVARVEMNADLEPWTAQNLAGHLHEADAMMGFMTDRVDQALLDQAPRLRVVACALKGFDNYDVEACTRAGVWLSIVPDLLTVPTAELAIGLAIALARNIRAGDALVRGGQFKGWRPRLYGTGLADSTVAVVGLGCVGRAIAARLAGFGCARIVGVDPAPGRVRGMELLPLGEALAQAHYVFVAAPLTPASLKLIDRTALELARPGQFIINVGRGSVVDEHAVSQALDSGRLAGYAADVFAMEDWGLPGRPSAIPPQLLLRGDTLLTPHLGSAVHDVRMAIEQRAADNIVAVLQGQAPPDAINVPRAGVPAVGRDDRTPAEGTA